MVMGEAVRERYTRIAQARLSGLTLKEIAALEQISIIRVHYIIAIYEMKTKQRITRGKAQAHE